MRSTRRTSISATQGRPPVPSARTTTWMPRRSASGPRGVDHPVREVQEVDVLEVECCGARVEAADLQEVGEQQLEPVQLVLEQLGGASRGRVEPLTSVVQHVTGHPHGGQRCAQLVRHVRDEPALHPRQLLQLADLSLQAGRHLVERRAEPCDVVVAANVHPLLETTGGQPLRDPSGEPHRRHDLSGDQPGDTADQDHQQHAGSHEGASYQREGALLLGHREQVVERVGAAVRGQRDLGAGDHAGYGGAAGRRVVADRRVGVGGLARRARGDLLPEPHGDARRRARPGCCWCRRRWPGRRPSRRAVR